MNRGRSEIVEIDLRAVTDLNGPSVTETFQWRGHLKAGDFTDYSQSLEGAQPGHVQVQVTAVRYAAR